MWIHIEEVGHCLSLSSWPQQKQKQQQKQQQAWAAFFIFIPVSMMDTATLL